MEDWIRSIVNSVASGLRSAIDAVTQRLSGLFSFITTVLVNLKNAFSSAVNGIVHGLNRLLSLARETYTTVRWIVVVRVPAAISSAVSSVNAWVIQQVNNARTYARGLYDSAIKWTTDRIRDITGTLNSFKDWVFNKVSEIIAAITRSNNLVFTLLTSPQRMATWLFDAMVAEFWRYLDRNSDRIFTFIRQRSIVYTLRFADRIEDMISRLL